MPRNRSITQSDFIYVGPTPATGQHFSQGNVGTNLVTGLYRVQSANYGKTVTRTDVNQFGELGAIDRIILESPTTNVDFQYLSNSLWNERIMGFTISSGNLVSCISGILNESQNEKNYFVRMVGAGNDVVGLGATSNGNLGQVIGLGNGFISSYTAEGSVGNFPTASVNVEGLNWVVNTQTGEAIPAVNPENGAAITTWKYTLPNIATSHPAASTISALRPGDVVVSLGSYAGDEAGVKTSDFKAQSYSISFDLSREDLQKLGSKYAFSKEITFPVTVNASITADVGDLQSGNFVDKVEADASYNLSIKIHQPNTAVGSRNDNNVAVAYILNNFKLDSENISSSIGDNKSVTLNFSSQLAGPQSTNGLFMSGLN